MMANAGEDIQEFSVLRSDVADAVGREKRKVHAASEFDGRLVAAFFFNRKMPLQFHVDVVFAECRA